jgi:hypothetical protein
MSSLRRLFLLGIVLLFSHGCTATAPLPVKSQITVFHELPPDISGMTYTVVPLEEQKGDLEYKSYEQAVRQELNSKGLSEAPLDQAKVVVFLSYSIDTGRQVMSSYPIIGQTGISSSSTYGGITTYTPSYGIVGSGVDSETIYRRTMELKILDKNDFVKGNATSLYQAKVVSNGRYSALPMVLPTMIKQLFEDFPGKNGSTRTSSRRPIQ